MVRTSIEGFASHHVGGILSEDMIEIASSYLDVNPYRMNTYQIVDHASKSCEKI